MTDTGSKASPPAKGGSKRRPRRSAAPAEGAPASAGVAAWRSRPAIATGLLVLALAALVAAFAGFKAAKITANPHFRADGPGSLYFSENAFHYHAARTFAEADRPFHRLAHDTQLEHPAELNVFRDETVLMEIPIGLSYRRLKPSIPFNVYLVYWHSLFSSLVLVPLFLITRRLTGNVWAGLAACLVYATTPASYGRMVGAVFLREDFALTWLVLSIWLLLVFVERGGTRLGLALGATMAIGLASWHVSPFFLAFTVPYLAWVLLTRPAALRLWFVPVAVIAAAGVAVPVLREKSFLSSPLMAAFVGVALAARVAASSRGRRRAVLALGAAALVLVVGLGFGSHGESYSHVYRLMAAKTAHLLQKPADPSRLSFEVRQLWEGDFNTPGPGLLWDMGRATLPVGLAAAAALLWVRFRRRTGDDSLLPAFLAVSLAGTTLLVARVLVLAVPFLALAPFLWLRERRSIAAAGAALVVLNAYGTTLAPMVVNKYPPDVYEKLFTWMRGETAPTDAFVAHMAVSPILTINTGRPGVLHAKFENRRIRVRNQELTAALYGRDEAALYDFLRRQQASLLVFDGMLFFWDSDDSDRYKAEQILGLDARSVAARLYFCDPTLAHFVPVYQNLYFTVFRVVEVKKDAATMPPPVSPERFRQVDGRYVETTATFRGLLEEAQRNVTEASGHLQAGRAEPALPLLQRAADLLPQYSLAVSLLASLHMDMGNVEAAERVADEYLRYKTLAGLAADPAETVLLDVKADALLQKGRHAEAASLFGKVLTLRNPDPAVHYKLATALRALGRADEARASYAAFLQTASLSPAERQAVEQERATLGTAASPSAAPLR